MMGVPTETLSFVMRAKSYCGYELLPVEKAPPWTNTITENFVAPLGLGAEMLSVRHSVSDSLNGENGRGFCKSLCSHSQADGGLKGIGLLMLT